MATEQLIGINVWLAGRNYRIRVRPEEEEPVRKAIKLADSQITELKNNYAGKDDLDFVAMALLMYAANSATEGNNISLIRHEIQELAGRIDTALTTIPKK